MQSSLCLTNQILPRFVFVAVASAAGATPSIGGER